MHVSILYFIEDINVQSLLFGLIILLIIRWFMTQPKRKYNLPPGPIAFPIIGNLPQLSSKIDFYFQLKELRKQYGDIFRLKIGSNTLVIVCKTEMILEGLVKKGDLLKGRGFVIYSFDKVFQTNGVVFSSGKKWKDQRKFAMSALRDLGVGKRSLEEKICLEAQTLVEIIQSYNGKRFNLRKVVSFYTSSIIYNIIFGKRIKFGEREYDEIIDHFLLVFQHISLFAPENFFPLLRFFRWNSPMEKVIRKQVEIRSYIGKKIAEHKETFNPEHIRDFLDVYLLSLEKQPQSETLTEDNLFQTIVDIFLAGTDTTATHLTWACLYMAKYKDVQNKCRKEIIEITKQNRPVTMEDKPYMTYVVATLHEIHRIATIATVIAPHAADVHITLGGYDIPKGSSVSFYAEAAHFDPNYWDNPEEFRPERWIGENNELKQNPAFMPFSLGPRMCLGMLLANTEAFLGFANILQKFQLEKPDETPMTLEGKLSGLSYGPVDNNIRAIPL